MKKIFGFVGHIASGKGAACDYFHEKHAAGYHRFSAILRDLVVRLYLPDDRDHLIRMSEALRREFGEDTLARVMAADVANDPAGIICIDGIRRVQDMMNLRQIAGFKLIYIEANPKIRYERLILRAQRSDEKNKTFEQFLADEQRPTETSIDEVKKQADIFINNNGSIEEFYIQLEKLCANQH